MRACFAVVPLGISALISFGCGPNSLGPDVHMVVANRMTSQSRTCGDESVSSLKASTLRVTVRNRSGMTSSFCDALIPGRDVTNVAFHFGGGTIDLFVEAFDDSHQRIASGSLVGVDPNAGALPELRLVATQGFRCLPERRLAPARAFHTATLLPNGEILVSGGAVPTVDGSDGPADDQGELFLTSNIQVLDSATGEITSPTDVGGVPRAFHHAVLLAGDAAAGPYHILLVGGVTGKNADKMPAIAPSSSLQQFGFRVRSVMALDSAPAEIVTYDPAAHSIQRASSAIPSAAFSAAAAIPSGGALVAGGQQGYPIPGSTDNTVYSTKLGVTKDGLTFNEGGSDLNDNRSASGLIVTDDSKWGLLVGGETDLNLPSVVALFLAGEIQVPLVPSAPVTPIAFPTVVSLPHAAGAAQFLVAGGLQVNVVRDMMKMGNPVTKRLAVSPPSDDTHGLWSANLPLGQTNLLVAPVNAGAGYTFDTTCLASGRYKPAAWNAASLLSTSDRVLVTGGTARNEPGITPCYDCEGGDNSPSCALSQAAVVQLNNDVQMNRVVPADEPLQIPRFGHTQTVLPNGMVILVGGLTRRCSNCSTDGSVDAGGKTYATWAVAEPEIWNPARKMSPKVQGGIDIDDPILLDLTAKNFTRAPGELAQSLGMPASPCTVVQ